MLDGRNQLDGGWLPERRPGRAFKYSGGGFVLLQMLIEDVSGRAVRGFHAERNHRSARGDRAALEWTPELEAAAPTPLARRVSRSRTASLASQAVGSEISTVADFARFVAAAASGPNGEPAWTRSAHARDGGPNAGDPAQHRSARGPRLRHSGAGRGEAVDALRRQPGWTAHFCSTECHACEASSLPPIPRTAISAERGGAESVAAAMLGARRL